MKKVLVVVLLVVIGFVVWKQTHPFSFTVETRNGEKIQVTELRFEPSRGLNSFDWEKNFTLHLGFGSFEVRKDLQDVSRIVVLNKDAMTLKVTDTSGETTEAKRSDDPKEFISDRIKGQSGKVRVFLSLRDVVSITRN